MDFTLSNAATIFPDGTSVAVYTLDSQPSELTNEPVGTPVTSATVASGAVTFTGLTSLTRYVAAAQVSGSWRRIIFTPGQDTLPSEASGTVGGVLSGSLPNPSFAVDMATQAELDAGLTGKEDVANKDIDGTLAANSDTKYPSQKAAKTYADTKLPASYLDVDGTLAANSDTKVPSQKATKTYADTKVPSSYLDTDGTLAANSDSKVATQQATKTYADTKLPSSYLDTDGTLAANSDTKIASQKAGKTYADTKIAKSLVDAKGDLLTATADDTPARLPVGSNGYHLEADSAQSSGLTWRAPFAWFNAKTQYGAVGDGTTDDYTAIQAALTAINSAGGGRLYLPPGIYRITQELTYYSNTIIQGAGRNLTTLKMANSFTTTNGALLKNSGYSGTGNDNVTVCDLKLDGNKANNTGWTGGQMFVARANAGSLCNNIQVVDCWVIDAPFQSLSFSRVKGVTARRNIVERSKRDSIVCYFTCENIHIQDNHLSAGADDHIALDAEAGNTDTANSPHALIHAVITGNNIRGPADAGAATGAGVVVRGAKDVVIADNNIADVSSNGVFLCDANNAPLQDIQVVSNQIRAAGTSGTSAYKNGIVIAVGQSTTSEHPNPPDLWTTVNRDFVIADNIIDTPVEAGILLRSAHSGTTIEDVIIANNRIKNPSSGGGIQLLSSSDAGGLKRCSVRGNKVTEQAGCRGIYANNANIEKLWVIGNDVYGGTGATSTGIYIDLVTDVVITDNVTSDNNSGGTNFAATSFGGDVLINNNLSFDNTGANHTWNNAAGAMKAVAAGRFSTFTANAAATTGNDTAPANGTIYYCALELTRDAKLTGIEILNGSAVGTDKVIVALYDANGVLVANSATAGTTASGIAAYQTVAFTAAKEVVKGLYFVALQVNGTTYRFRSIPAGSLRPATGSVAGTFGTLPSITPPTTFTSNVGPIANTY